MTPEQFRESGHALIDWIADHRAGLEALPVQSTVAPGEIRAALPKHPPLGTVPIDALLADLDRVVVPGMTNVQHPSHFGWFPSNASLASVLGDLASSGLGGLGISWQSCPALTEVEETMCDWMRQLVGLSEQWHGTIHDTASTAVLVALLCARERATDFSMARGGLSLHDRPLVVYTSPHAHSSVQKAALLAGFGRDHVRSVDVEPWTQAMIPDALDAAMHRDAHDGLQPCAVVATVGTTGTTAVDPLAPICDVADEHGAWVHVDAALAGSAMLLPECRYLWRGVEAADSLTWNPHKWMGTVLDCSLMYVRDPQHLIRVMSTNPAYLRSTVDGQVTQYRDWGIPLGRRFRALKLWFQLRLDGVESIKARLRRDLNNAQWLVAQVESTDSWEVLAPVPLQTVCVRHAPEPLADEVLDAHTLRWAEMVNHSGKAFLTPSMLDGRWMVRVSIGVEQTERRHVDALWALMRRCADESAASIASE